MSSSKNSVKDTLKLYYFATLFHKKDAFLSIFTPLGVMFTNIGVPYFAGKALASISIRDATFGRSMTLLGLSALGGIILNRIGFTHLMIIQAKVMSDLNTKVLGRVLSRGTSFHVNTIGGKMVSDALDFVTSYSMLVMTLINSASSLLLVVTSGLVIVFLQSWQLGCFLGLVVVLTSFFAYKDALRRSYLRNERLKASKVAIGHISDVIVNAQTVKTFSAESYELNKSIENNKVLLKLRLSDWTKAARSGNNRITLLLVMLCFLLLFVKYLSERSPAILGIGFFAFTYTFTLMLRLFEINTLTRQVEESFLQASPMTKIFMEEDEVKDHIDAKGLVVGKGEVAFKNVSFSYKESQHSKEVFSSFDLIIKPGEKVGFVGPSGGGKSTLTKLLLRFEDLTSGEILIDEQNIAKVTQQSLRSAIAYVPQEPLLFHRSILENIAYAKEYTKAEVIAAAKMAHAHDFIEELPKGYNTIVGERGVKLSGGQRQRVAIARAILRQSPILILDEATSALDSEAEAYIQDALWKLMEHKTALVIAHRLSTIQKMDRIVLLDNGKIVELGTHKELLAKKGLYTKLWKHQSGDFLQS